ncbi:16163_t:CDS:1, partial [Racocetra persica]
QILIIQTHEDKLEIPQEVYSSDENNFFNTYESEDNLDKVKSYHIDGIQTDDEKLFLNPWKDVYSPAIYLTTIKEISTSSNSNKPELSPTEIVNRLVNVEILNNEQQIEAIHILEKFCGLFTSGLDELGQYQEIQHKINTGNAKPIK